MRFQLSFSYPADSPIKDIFLNYEIRSSAPETLYFEALTGLRGYEKSNEYHGLESEILKYVSLQIDE